MIHKTPSTPSTRNTLRMAPAHSKRPTRHRAHTSLSTKLDLDSAFFWLLFTFLLTAFTFFSLRDRHLSLDTSQIAEYDRRAQLLSNSTVYIVEVGRPETLLSALSASDWKRVSTDIDYVAFVWDDLPIFLTDEWVSAAEAVLPKDAVSIGLFSCGCVIPNIYFEKVGDRFDGFECVLLPGWVLKEKEVVWLDGGMKDGACKRRREVLGKKVVKGYKERLRNVQKIVQALRVERLANMVDDSKETQLEPR